MRNDYAYIEQAAGPCLTTIPLGHDHLARLTDDEIGEMNTPLDELLPLLEHDHNGHPQYVNR